jgi:hypothetical protein
VIVVALFLSSGSFSDFQNVGPVPLNPPDSGETQLREEANKKAE